MSKKLYAAPKPDEVAGFAGNKTGNKTELEESDFSTPVDTSTQNTTTNEDN